MTRTTEPTSTSVHTLRRGGFTIVELLVVISIIAILLSVVSVGIVQAGKSARQTKLLSNLKQVATAWTQYANQNDDRAMIGYMDDAVQAAFKIKVRDRDGNRVDAQFCRTYPFRLLPFLDHDRSLMYDYLADYEQTSLIPPAEIAANPAFGYNAYYLGGWWTVDGGQTDGGGTPGPRMRFSNTGYFKAPGQLVARQEMVARSLSQIQRPSDMVVFGSSFAAQPGFVKNPNELARGSAWVCPSRRATAEIWAASDGSSFNTMQTPGTLTALVDPGTAGGYLAQLFRTEAPRQVGNIVLTQGGAGMDVFAAESVPLRRIKNTVPTVRADLSTEAQGLRDLMNQSRWMNNAGYSADPYQFTHPE